MVYIKKADRVPEEMVAVQSTSKPSAEVINNVKVKIEYKPFDNLSVSKEVLAKYPEDRFHLLWARNDAKRTSILENEGYDYVTVDPSKRNPNRPKSDRSEDSCVRHGDSILMYCSVELYEAKKEYTLNKSNSLQPKKSQSIADVRRTISGIHPTITNRQEFSQVKGVDPD